MQIAKSKSILAKLFAQENITVEHKNVSTAYFELSNRVLVCPIWKNMSEELYDLLMGHEVGHALFTPPQGWHNAITKEGAGFKSFLNVIEDIRIERLIKEKFPGIRRSFFSGYKSLYENDFFGLSKLDYSINDLPFIDRINLHYKVGMFLNVKFHTDETEYLKKIDNISSWEDTESIAKELFELAKNTESKFTYDGLKFNLGEEAEDSEDDTDDLDVFDDSEDMMEIPSDPISITDESFRHRERSLVSSDKTSFKYFLLPEVNWEARVIDYKTVHKNMIFCIEKTKSLDYLDQIKNKLFAEFKKKNEKYVAYMVKEFELRKNARQFARASVSKTGEINTKKLFAYKITEDLFNRVTTVPNGKNHGMIMFVDFSRSMEDKMKSTLEQTIILAMFCRKINVPFSVYSFTNCPDIYGEIDSKYKNCFMKKYVIGNQKIDDPHFRMREYISSRMSSTEFKNAIKNLIFLSMTFMTRYEKQQNKFDYYTPPTDELHSTPLDATVIASIEMVKQFRKNYRLDIVNTIFLTDGQSDTTSAGTDTSGHGYHSWKERGSSIVRYVTDPVTKLVGASKNHQPMTCAYLQLLKKITDCNVIGFFISDKRLRHTISNYNNIYGSSTFLTDKELTSIRSNGFHDIEGDTYDHFFIMSGGRAQELEEAEISVDKDFSKNDLKKAFMKYRSRISFNRMFLNRFASVIS
jgi:hypothetical protein